MTPYFTETARIPLSGGESGIRTHGGCYTTHAFQACALSHSAISPAPGPYSSPAPARHGGSDKDGIGGERCPAVPYAAG